MVYWKYYIIYFCISFSCGVYGKGNGCEVNREKVDSLVNSINEKNVHEHIEQIDKIFKKNESCFKSYEITNVYADLAEKTFGFTNDGDLTYCLKKKAILKGDDFFMVLEDAPAIYLKDNYSDYYRDLEHLSDSVFLINNPNINIELAFVLRSMVRRDQEVRQRKWIADDNKEKSLSDSLYTEMSKADKLNEQLLGEIFERYGYPGYSMVGGEHNACSLLMHHMSIDFQAKYIHLLDKAVADQELFEELDFLIDKILYGKFKVTLYGTHWSNAVPESDPEIIKKYRSLLNLSTDS